MVIKKKKTSSKIEIDLTGPEGNAFAILGVAKKLCDVTGKDWEDIIKRMQSGDYNNLISVLEKEFGNYVIIYR